MSYLTNVEFWLSAIALIISVFSLYQTQRSSTDNSRMNLMTRRDLAAQQSYHLNAQIQLVDFQLSQEDPNSPSIPEKRIEISSLKKQLNNSKAAYEQSEHELADLENRDPQPLGLETLLFPAPAKLSIKVMPATLSNSPE